MERPSLEPTPALNQVLTPALDERRIAELLRELAREARRFRFQVAPNPCVGAAVLSDDQVVARGYHELWGGPHAEVLALAAAARAQVPAERLDTLACTLEPCSTTGKTGPCTELLLSAGVRRVVVGALDPDPRHRGQGLELLARAGVEVQLVARAAPLEEASPHFLEWTSNERLRRPRPWTIAKWAQTLTGQLVPPLETGPYISSPESRDEVQRLRERVDAIVTGVGTVLRDDPRLTVRAPGDPARAPLRVVLDTVLRTPPGARLLQPLEPGHGGGRVVLICEAGASLIRRRALEEAGAEVVPLHRDQRGGISLRDVQTWLWQRGVRRLLLEAGPKLTDAYLEAGFVDQLRVYTAELRGGQGLSLARWLAPDELEERLDRESGPDAVLEAFRRRRP